MSDGASDRDRLAAIARATLVEGVRVHQALAERAADGIAAAAAVVRDALAAGGKVLLCGNGGSAADAQHIAAELVGRFVAERRPLPAIALTTDTSALTAIGNDYGFDAVFARQVEALGRPGDVLIAITTSGRSRNVLAAVAAARVLDLRVIGMTGAAGAAFAATCDAAVIAPTTETARIQECHIAAGHVLCELVDDRFAQPSARAGARVSAAGKELSLDELVAFRAACKAAGRTVVWTNGVFDVFHVGHLRSLRAARAFGDVLVVGTNSDASVKAIKGPSRPIFPAAERVELLAGLECVDAVIVYEEPTAIATLRAVQPDVYVKGGEYAPGSGKVIPEAETVLGFGARIELIPMVPGRSSTDTLARLRQDP